VPDPPQLDLHVTGSRVIELDEDEATALRGGRLVRPAAIAR
jgi:hypothetical protein